MSSHAQILSILTVDQAGQYCFIYIFLLLQSSILNNIQRNSSFQYLNVLVYKVQREINDISIQSNEMSL